MHRPNWKSVRLVGTALLVACPTTACYTFGLQGHAQPVDRGRVRQALRTADGGLELHFEDLSTGWSRPRWYDLPIDAWCPVLVLSQAELDAAFSQASGAGPDPEGWPRTLIGRARLEERRSDEVVMDTPTEAFVPVAHVARADWPSWPGEVATVESSQSSMQVAFESDCWDPIAGPTRSLALLCVRDGPGGRRRAVLFIEPAPGKPRFPLLLVGLALDTLCFGWLLLLP